MEEIKISESTIFLSGFSYDAGLAETYENKKKSG